MNAHRIQISSSRRTLVAMAVTALLITVVAPGRGGAVDPPPAEVPASKIGYGLAQFFDMNGLGEGVMLGGGAVVGAAAGKAGTAWALGKLGAQVGAATGFAGAAVGFVAGAV